MNRRFTVYFWVEYLNFGTAVSSDTCRLHPCHPPDGSGVLRKDTAMKFLLCKDLQLGAVCTVNLGQEKAREWNTARFRKFEHLLHTAGTDDGGYLFLFGHTLGSRFISGEYTDAINALIAKEEAVQVITCTTEEDSRRLASSPTRPSNLHILAPSIMESYEDDRIIVSLEENDFHIRSKADDASFTVDAEGRIAETSERIPAFEPCGFEDAAQESFGYLVERTAYGNVRGEYRTSSIYAYRFLRMAINAQDTNADIVKRAERLVAANDTDTFVRLILTGTTGIGVEVNCEAVAEALMKHVFFAEVIDTSSVDLSGYKPEAGISLANEFVRLAMTDPTLGETERSKIVRNGWNALNEVEDDDE